MIQTKISKSRLLSEKVPSSSSSWWWSSSCANGLRRTSMVLNILPTALSVVKYGFYSALSIVAVGGGLLYKYQTSLIYPANMPEGEYLPPSSPFSSSFVSLRLTGSIYLPGSRTKVPIPSDFGIQSFEDITLITPDGIKIKAFVMLSAEKPEVRPTVLLCHANAGNVVRTA